LSSQALSAQAKQLFQHVFEQASLGIAVEDIEGKLLLANRSLCSMLGYRDDELIGMNCCEFANPEDSQDDWALFQKLQDGIIDRYSLEKRYVRKDGTQLWGSLNVSLLKNGDEVGSCPLVFAFVEDITERKLAEATLANVSRRLIEAQEQERARIGRELHDDIGQRLAMLVIGLGHLQGDPPDLSEFQRLVGELNKQASEIAADLQSLSHELHSAKLEYLGLAAATRAFCKGFSEQHNVEIDIKTDDLPSSLSADVSLCLFRILQEALHNSTKHSGVRQFEVRLWGTVAEIHLTVRDSGAGFDREAAKQSRGLGLISMEERLKLVNGKLSIESQFQRGTTIHARAPFSGSDSMQAAD
jgi:PAS domain S-box-containing protein